MANQILTGRARMLPGAGEMVRDPGPRAPVSIDTRAAVGTVTADARAFVGADLAGADMGKAIGGIGDSLGKLAMAQMDAINLRKEAEAQAHMEAGEAEMKAAMVAEPDETKWGGIAAKHIEATRGRIAKMDLSPVAKAAVEDHMIRWVAHREGQVKIESARQSISRARQVINDRLERASLTQNSGQFESTLGQAVNAGYISADAAEVQRLKYKDTGERLAKQAQAEARDAQYSAHLAMIQQDPFGYKVEGVDDPVLRDRLDMQARQQRGLMREDAVSALADGLADGTVKSAADIDAMDSPALTSSDKAKWKGILKDSVDEKAMEKARAEAPAKSAALEAEVRAWDAEADPDREKLQEFIRRKMELPAGWREDIDNVIDRKRKQLDPDPDKATYEAGRDSISAAFRDGLLNEGPVISPPGQYATAQEKADYDRKMAVVRQQAGWRASALLKAWKAETKAKPDMTLLEGQGVLSRLMSRPVEFTAPGPSALLFPGGAPDMGDNLTPIDAAKEWDTRLSGYGPETDLPDNPAPADNSLLLPK